VTLGAVPSDPSNLRQGTFEFTCDEETCDFECSFDDGPFAGCASPAMAPAFHDGSCIPNSLCVPGI